MSLQQVKQSSICATGSGQFIIREGTLEQLEHENMAGSDSTAIMNKDETNKVTVLDMNNKSIISDDLVIEDDDTELDFDDNVNDPH